MRREFALPASDHAFLDAAGLSWEALRHGGEFWIFIHDFELPAGYRAPKASVAIKIEAGYPNAQLDMAYFHPALARTDGKAIPASDVVVQIDGKAWQRWSRHRTAANPWSSGEDSLETHLVLVRDWLVREFERRR